MADFENFRVEGYVLSERSLLSRYPASPLNSMRNERYCNMKAIVVGVPLVAGP